MNKLLDRCCLLCRDTQEEHLRNLILRRSDVDDHGARCLADAVRAINNLATAQVRNDTPSLIDVKGLGRPKEFTGLDEDFQQWSKKTEASFAGVIKESEMMLEWAAEQPTEVTTTAIDLEFLPTDTNEDRGMQDLEFVRKNPLEAWRR